MYATPEDLKTNLYQYQTQQISEGDEDIILRAIAAAEEEVKSYFYTNAKKEYLDGRLRYDVDKIFSATGTERNPLILNIVVNVAVWHFITLAHPDMLHEWAKERYDRAIEWLKKLNKGEVSLGNLPLIKESGNANTSNSNEEPFVFGSRRKFNHE